MLTKPRSWFQHADYIWDSIDQLWWKSDECIWLGPAFLLHTPVLSLRYPNDRNLEVFFMITLGIKNWAWSHITSDLLIRSTGVDAETVDKACEIYEFLASNVRDDSDWQLIR
jgi:hypothetical protein